VEAAPGGSVAAAAAGMASTRARWDASTVVRPDPNPAAVGTAEAAIAAAARTSSAAAWAARVEVAMWAGAALVHGLCQVPADTLPMRTEDPERALAWRYALRDTMGAALAAGFLARTLLPEGWYVLTPRRNEEATG
jgi:hypothetical protein